MLDTSAVVDYLLGQSSAGQVKEIIDAEGGSAAPDIVVSETLSALRRLVARSVIRPYRAGQAVSDLGDISVALFPTLAFRERAWRFRDNMTAADALFVALAEALDEPLVTKDHRLATATRRHTGVRVVELVG
ncbi:MAG: type II toxin-antitoxin system VapC family toxin [Ornithinimicrobium sp.]|uniref:type II toxin-antitoxin system VapC family toxin n=1 Tax=Ornithinimicrobium sp. TaxID=1977084 RepID=UPI003D9B764C